MAITFNPLTLASFNGTSKFAGDLQNVINHAVNVAAIPLTQLGNNANQLQGQQTGLSALQTQFAAIQTAIKSLSSANSGSLTASIADDSIATVSLDASTAVSGGTYTLSVLNAGAHTLTLSNAGATVTDPSSTSLSTSGSFTLTVNGTPTTITPAANTLSALAQAINTSGAGVSAVIVNLGSASSPDYRLSLQGSALHDDAIQLNDGSQDLIGTLTHGTEATYQVDGQPSTPISSSTGTVTLAPGLTAKLLQTGDTTITVEPDPSAAETALSAFATAYNAAVSGLALNHGTSGGSLTGQPIVSQLEQTLRGLLTYSGGSGSVQGLTDLGLTFDSAGKLVFNQATFESAQAANPAGVSSFLGSTSGTGTGFLGAANSTLTNLEDPINGLFKKTNDSYQKQIDADVNEINATEARITTMQATLVAQMSQADAALATLDSQLTMLTALFTATQDAANNNH